jgi:hypothetical protein
MGGWRHAPAVLPPGRTSGAHSTGGWVGRRTCPDGCRKIEILLKSDKNNGYFALIPIYIFFITSRWVLLRLRSVSEENIVEKIKTQILYSIRFSFFLGNRTVYEIMVEKYCTAGQTTDDNMADAHRTLITPGHKHTLSYLRNALFLFHCNNCCTNDPHCWATRTLSLFFLWTV